MLVAVVCRACGRRVEQPVSKAVGAPKPKLLRKIVKSLSRCPGCGRAYGKPSIKRVYHDRRE